MRDRGEKSKQSGITRKILNIKRKPLREDPEVSKEPFRENAGDPLWASQIYLGGR